jgi:hypothetical protein
VPDEDGFGVQRRQRPERVTVVACTGEAEDADTRLRLAHLLNSIS